MTHSTYIKLSLLLILIILPALPAKAQRLVYEKSDSIEIVTLLKNAPPQLRSAEYVIHFAKALAGKGVFYDKSKLPATIRRGDVCFWLFDGSKMTNTSKKHVNVCVEDTDSRTIWCIGGNQDDRICAKLYDRSQLYAVYRV